MIFVDDIKELLEIVKKDQLIIYGAGRGCINILEFINVNEINTDINLIVVSTSRNNPTSVLDIPVVSLDCIGHYCYDGTILVSVYKKDVENVLNNLEHFKNIIILSDDLLDNLVRYNSERFVSNSKIMRKMIDNNREIMRCIEIQKELEDLHRKTFEKYKNFYRNREIVIVATGPSIDKYVPIRNAIHIGVNGAINYNNIPLDYYFIQDGRRDLIGAYNDAIEKSSCEIFVGKYLKGNIEWLEHPVNYFNNKNVNYYYTGKKGFNDIYIDISYHALLESGSVIFPALQFALYTYPKRIYLVGCDTTNGNHGKKHPINEKTDLAVSKCKAGYARIKEFSNLYYPETEIISINPVGLKGLFNDIYT